MDKITAQEVTSLATLSRLALTDAEVAATTKDISNILGHFSAIGSIDTTHATPHGSASGLVGVVREDVVHANVLCTATELLSNAPQTQGAYVKVPGVFSESEIS